MATNNIDDLKKQLKAELMQEIEEEIAEKKKAAEEEIAKKQKAVEEASAKHEAMMEKELARQEKSVKEQLRKEKKVKIFIPENPLNPGEVVPVGLNGVIYAIPAGQEFEVPESIYNVWKYSYEKTREANMKMDRILNKELKILE